VEIIMSAESDEFERLVSRIEQAVCPQGVIVKSPEWIIDNVTGRKRQIDATIRFKVGTASILIVIECRKRDDVVEDVTWIEQLATKSKDVGAAKTIAVSDCGFT
jgi:hypothetical protein